MATPPPANDDFADAQALDVGRYLARETIWGGLWGANKEPGEPDHAGVVGGASIWYSWTPPHGGAAHAVGCAREIAVYTGEAVDDLTEVASESTGSGGYCPEVWFDAVRGTTYRIALDGAYDASKGYVPMDQTYMIVALAPENDDFADAVTLPSESKVEFSELTEEATKEPGEPDHAGNAGGRSIWFRWTAPESATFHLGTCDGDGFDTLLAVYTGASLQSLVQVASNDNGAASACRGTRSELSFAATAGVTYRFAVDGYDGASARGACSLKSSGSAAAGRRAADPPPGPVDKSRQRRATFSFTARAGTPRLRSSPAASTATRRRPATSTRRTGTWASGATRLWSGRPTSTGSPTTAALKSSSGSRSTSGADATPTARVAGWGEPGQRRRLRAGGEREAGGRRPRLLRRRGGRRGDPARQRRRLGSFAAAAQDARRACRVEHPGRSCSAPSSRCRSSSPRWPTSDWSTPRARWGWRARRPRPAP